ncbi:MAG: SufD family Fe-S cluster assembly protein [Puniceicoccales bacterium]|jgi:Fe-S cluster assembly scaffold protein SufB|nr:SufD family Fe-S cluster assembly protein [Puniceicoccales bacterium]
MPKRRNITNGVQQVCLSEWQTVLDFPENSHELMQLRVANENCRLAGVLCRNSSVKIFAELTDLRNSNLEVEFNLREGAKLEIVCFIGRCMNAKLIQKINLSGKYSSAVIRNACKTRGEENVSIRVAQVHTAAQSKSSAITSVVADGSSNASVAGIIDVSQNSHGSESEQYAKGILLSDSAEITMSPNLNILSSDVACKHGAASGGLDDGAVLYAQSRGTSPIQTKKILADGFMFSTFDDLNHHFWATCLMPLKENT